MSRVTVAVARFTFLTAQWPLKPSIGQNLQPWRQWWRLQMKKKNLIRTKNIHEMRTTLKLIQTAIIWLIFIRALPYIDTDTYWNRYDISDIHINWRDIFPYVQCNCQELLLSKFRSPPNGVQNNNFHKFKFL